MTDSQNCWKMVGWEHFQEKWARTKARNELAFKLPRIWTARSKEGVKALYIFECVYHFSIYVAIIPETFIFPAEKASWFRFHPASARPRHAS